MLRSSFSLFYRKFVTHSKVVMNSQFSTNKNDTVDITGSNKELVRVMKQDKLHLIAINRPEKRNCVNPETAFQLKSAFEQFENDNNALVAILHGIGGTFCAGYDLKEIAAGNKTNLSVEDGPMGPSRMALKKPVIAAIDGYAVAGGFELAIWCDLRVVEETAIMGVFCRRFGVPLMDGGTVRLPHIIGLGRALDLILTGRGINGKEANEMGLVTKLCKKGQVFSVTASFRPSDYELPVPIIEPEEGYFLLKPTIHALETAINLAKDLCKYPQACMNADRISAYKAIYDTATIQEALKFEHENAVPVLIEAMQGAKQFVQGVGKHGKDLEKSDKKSKL